MIRLIRRSLLRGSLGLAAADAVLRGIKPEDAAEKALRRVEEIFASYPLEQA